MTHPSVVKAHACLDVAKQFGRTPLGYEAVKQAILIMKGFTPHTTEECQALRYYNIRLDNLALDWRLEEQEDGEA